MSVATSTEPSRRRRKIKSPRFALALPAGFFFLFFFAIPILFIVAYSFGRKPDIFHSISMSQLSFDRYSESFTSTFFSTFIQTVRLSLVGSALTLLIGFPFAYWLAVKAPQKYRGLLLGLVLVPFWTNLLVRTIGWRILMAPDGLIHPLVQVNTKGAVYLGVVYNYLPLAILPMFVALDRINPALREAAKDLGANKFKTLTQVTMPLAMPGIAASMLLVFIPLMGDYITPSVLGGSSVFVMGNLVVSQFLAANNWAQGSATAMILILTILITVAVFGLIGLGLRALVRQRRRVVIDTGGMS